MEPFIMIVVPGFLGGLVIALLFNRLDRGRSRPTSDPFTDVPRTDVINMARVRVAGVGGLGLVAMALVVAVFVPRIRESVLLGLLLGVVFATILIVRRRREGPMPSSGQGLGANTTLAIDSRPVRQNDGTRSPSDQLGGDLMTMPATLSRIR